LQTNRALHKQIKLLFLLATILLSFLSNLTFKTTSKSLPLEALIYPWRLNGHNRLPETCEALLNPDDRPLSASGYSPEALRAAIYFVDRSSCADENIAEAMLFAGDGNYCPVLVGAISGVRY
jgi:hypothetical protein